ncbi:MAG: rhodanese-like domain-containing protein [Oscillospiraceae bacterium]|nr:rhodanese-like domain-containing protein [Oscillospiraceae bacterium]
MGLFDKLKGNDIDAGVQLYRRAEGALLIDVRSREEYAQGHIPGSINLSPKELRNIDEIAVGTDQKLFLYCLVGARSAQAASMLKAMGYKNAVSIGGIESYHGELEK